MEFKNIKSFDEEIKDFKSCVETKKILSTERFQKKKTIQTFFSFFILMAITNCFFNDVCFFLREIIPKFYTGQLDLSCIPWLSMLRAAYEKKKDFFFFISSHSILSTSIKQ